MDNKKFNPQKIEDYNFDPKVSKADIKCILLMFRQTADPEAGKQAWIENVEALCEPFGFASDLEGYNKKPQEYKGSISDVNSVISAAITGKRDINDLYEFIKTLGKPEITRRIGKVLQLLKVEKDKFIDKIEIV